MVAVANLVVAVTPAVLLVAVLVAALGNRFGPGTPGSPSVSAGLYRAFSPAVVTVTALCFVAHQSVSDVVPYVSLAFLPHYRATCDVASVFASVFVAFGVVFGSDFVHIVGLAADGSDTAAVLAIVFLPAFVPAAGAAAVL